MNKQTPIQSSIRLTFCIWVLILGWNLQPLAAQNVDLLKQAFEKITEGDFEEGLVVSLAAVESLPDSAESHFFAGLCLSNLGRCLEATPFWDAALDLDPDFVEAYLERARCLSGSGQAEMALKDIRNCLRRDPLYVDALLLRAEIYLAEGDADLAMKDLDLAKRLAPRMVEVYTLRAEALWSLGDVKASLKEANHAVKLAPGDPLPYITRSQANLVAGNLIAALADADQAILLAPEAHGLRNTRAYILLQLDRLEDAHAELDLLLSKDSSAAEAHLTRALLFERVGDLSMAVIAAEHGLNLRPQDIAIREQLGFLLLQKGQDSLAALHLDTVLQADDQRAFSLHCIGLAHANLGKVQQGLKELDRAIKLDPYDPRAYFHRAKAQIVAGKTEKGCLDLNEAEKMGFADYYNPEELETLRKESCGK